MTNKKLGRGLQSLLGGFADDGPVAAASTSADGAVQEVALIDLEPNPFQPRRDYNSEDLASLTQSIQAHGVLQPLLVRPREGRYQIVAGERRFRSAQEAGRTRGPVRVVSADDQKSVEFALVENIHRSDLTPMEKAQAFAQIRVTLEELPPGDRELLTLRYALEYDAGHIAELLGINATAVHMRLRRARQRLADKLTAQGTTAIP